ncbi:MAG TPA: FHA domain-containing protein [Negativicutes bacterium]
MPNKTLVFTVVGMVFQYGLLVLLYYFLFKVIKVIYTDLQAPTPKQSQLKPFDDIATDEPQAKLCVIDRGKILLATNSFILAETICIGRSEDNDIVIDDTFVSHEHACITRYKHVYWLTDLNSTNKTYLNSQQVTDEVLLHNGDLIQIGAVTFRFER